MKIFQHIVESPLRPQAPDALKRARKLPVGAARNDLRQLAVGLRWVEKHSKAADVADAIAEWRKHEDGGAEQ